MRPQVRDGVLQLKGAARLLLAGDYPYYRDPPELWAPKLRMMRAAGLEVVSFYVPWRHHEVAFDGCESKLVFYNDGNRDLVGFIGAIQAAGLYALPKPGPFVHAELPFGGLPDRLSPSSNPLLQAAMSAHGAPLAYERYQLPSMHDPAFLAQTADWLASVGDVLRPWLCPQGPVVAVQIGNEGCYGEMARGLNRLDYSACGLAAFDAAFPGQEAPRSGGLPGVSADPGAYLRWGLWSGRATMAALEWMAGRLALDVPVFTNNAPPKPEQDGECRHHDSWLARSAAGSTRLHYGYTSWVGNVVADDRALVDYVLAAALRRGPNLEENWSLSWAEADCAFACRPVYQALLGLAFGATGLNVYTACATTAWGAHLSIRAEDLDDPARARFLDPPYGDIAPIGPAAEAGPGFRALCVLTHFLSFVGASLVGSEEEPGLAFWLYPPYGAIAAWGAPADGEATAPSSSAYLTPFALHCLMSNIPFCLIEDDPSADRPIVAASGAFMTERRQRVLANHIEDGGALLLIGQQPEMDEEFKSCRVLRNAIASLAPSVRSSGRVRVLTAGVSEIGAAVDDWLRCLPEVRRSPARAGWMEIHRRAPAENGRFVFFFNRTDSVAKVESEIGSEALTLDLAPYGCAIVHVVADELAGFYSKGLNEKFGSGVAPRVRFGRSELIADEPCDVSVIRRGRDFIFETNGSDKPLRMTLVHRL